MILVLFILGGIIFGFSLLFFFAPENVVRKNISGPLAGKVNKEGIEGMINKEIYVNEKRIIESSPAIGILLILITTILFWTGWTLLK